MKVTINHQEIKKWIVDHNGKPDLIQTPGVGNPELGLRIDFPTKDDDKFLSRSTVVTDLSWEDFFRRFEEMKLAFMCDENTRYKESGDYSDDYRFIKRDMLNEKISKEITADI